MRSSYPRFESHSGSCSGAPAYRAGSRSGGSGGCCGPPDTCAPVARRFRGEVIAALLAPQAAATRTLGRCLGCRIFRHALGSDARTPDDLIALSGSRPIDAARAQGDGINLMALPLRPRPLFRI